jgi:hypothetical protein
MDCKNLEEVDEEEDLGDLMQISALTWNRQCTKDL